MRGRLLMRCSSGSGMDRLGQKENSTMKKSETGSNHLLCVMKSIIMAPAAAYSNACFSHRPHRRPSLPYCTFARWGTPGGSACAF
jgi:hypothetical protein